MSPCFSQSSHSPWLRFRPPLVAKIPGPVLGTTIRNNVLLMEHIPLCKVAPKDYDWEVNSRNKFCKDCRRVRRYLYMR
jgi:hypothetical protein